MTLYRIFYVIAGDDTEYVANVPADSEYDAERAFTRTTADDQISILRVETHQRKPWLREQQEAGR